MIRTLAYVLLLGALIGFSVYSEIRQRTLASRQSQIDQAILEERAEKEAAQQTQQTNDHLALRTVDMNLLTEAGWGHTEKVRVLLESGAEVNARDTNGDTPLIATAFMGFNETVRLLLDKGADINAKNNLASTALIEAAAMDRREIVELLLSNGADKKVRNMAGLTALDAALRENNTEIAHLLKSGVVKRQGGPASYSYMAIDAGLQQAALDGDVSKIPSLVAGGANVNAKNKDGRTPLILAAMQGRADVLQALLNSGADPNAQDKQGNTAMSVVRQSGQIYLGQLLKKAGAKTPLHNQVLSQP